MYKGDPESYFLSDHALNQYSRVAIIQPSFIRHSDLPDSSPTAIYSVVLQLINLKSTFRLT
jgi:hypothetical protein